MNQRHMLGLVFLSALLSPAATFAQEDPEQPAPSLTLVKECQDATIFADPDGEPLPDADGHGEKLYTGRDQDANRKRALLKFDLTGVSREVTVIDAKLILHLTNVSGRVDEPRTVELRKLVQDWTEGPASARGNDGSEAQDGDVTWEFASFPETSWFGDEPTYALIYGKGGSYDGSDQPTDRVEVTSDDQKDYEFSVTEDVKSFLDQGGINSGWGLLTNYKEPNDQRFVAFASAQHSRENWRPRLVLTFASP